MRVMARIGASTVPSPGARSGALALSCVPVSGVFVLCHITQLTDVRHRKS